MSGSYIKLKEQTISDALRLTVQDQYDLADKLAHNCGYQLFPEDNETNIQIRNIIKRMKDNGPAVSNEGDREFIMQGLEKLL